MYVYDTYKHTGGDHAIFRAVLRVLLQAGALGDEELAGGGQALLLEVACREHTVNSGLARWEKYMSKKMNAHTLCILANVNINKLTC